MHRTATGSGGNSEDGSGSGVALAIEKQVIIRRLWQGYRVLYLITIGGYHLILWFFDLFQVTSRFS